MLSWIVDHAVLIYVFLGLFGLGAALSYRQSRDRRNLYGFLAAAGLALLVFLLSFFVVTDRQQLEKNVGGMVTAVLTGNENLLRKRLAPDFNLAGRDRDNVARSVVSSAKSYGVSNIYIFKWRVDELSRSDKKAVASFGARVDLAGNDQYLVQCKATFVLIGDDWLLRSIEFFNPVVNQDQPIAIPLR